MDLRRLQNDVLGAIGEAAYAAGTVELVDALRRMLLAGKLSEGAVGIEYAVGVGPPYCGCRLRAEARRDFR